MYKLAYRLAGAFCCVSALLMLCGAIYFPFFTIMAIPAKVIFGLGALFAAGTLSIVGVRFLLTGGPM